MTAEFVLEVVHQNGGALWIEGGKLKYRLPADKSELIPVMRELKSEILEYLSERPAMPAGLRLGSWEPKPAPVRLSEFETVVDVHLFIDRTLAQLDARLQGKDWLAGNWPLSTLLDRLAACGCVVALTDPKAARATLQ